MFIINLKLNNKQILEAVKRGVSLALDGFEDSSDILPLTHGKIKDIKYSTKEYINFITIIERLLNNDQIYPRKLDQIAAFKEMIKLHNDYGFLYEVHTTKELKNIIKVFIDIWPTSTNNFNWIDISSLTSLLYVFSDPSIREKIHNVIVDEWNTSNIKDISFMAWNCKWFDADLSKWDVHNVEYASGAFLGCTEYFNSDLSKWDVSNLKSASSMFLYCHNFNSNISNWNTSNLIDAGQMFKECTNFNCDISKWDVQNILQAHMMFLHCKNFKLDLSQWNLKKCNSGNRGLWFRQMFECTPMEYEYNLYPELLLTSFMKISIAMKKKDNEIL